MLCDLIYMKDPSLPLQIFKLIMMINPGFHFSCILGEISVKAGYSFDMTQNIYVQGPGFFWKDFFKSDSESLFGSDYSKPSPFGSTCLIYLDFVIYLVLLWLVDNLVSTNRGFARNPFYFLRNLCGKKSQTGARPIIRTNNEQERPIVNGDENNVMVDEKIERLGSEVHSQELLMDDYNLSSTQKGGIVLHAVSKTYKPICSCSCKKSAAYYALKRVDLEISRGELFALLGPNGAGKTTMIGILSGVLSPTQGKLWSWGLSGNEESSKIRTFTNVCPQFDILWAELTIFDHIKMISKIKGLITNDYKDYASKLLRKVNLESNLNTKIQNLSGGMRRRVSIALSTIGNPNIIIFDEPTTGLDPENRRLIWKFINNLKTNERSIMLTTHLLEEAEILSDRIGILSKGKLLQVGTSAELKRNMGKGYKVTILVSNKYHERIEDIKKIVSDMIPNSVLYASSGGNLLFQIPFEAEEKIPD